MSSFEVFPSPSVLREGSCYDTEEGLREILLRREVESSVASLIADVEWLSILDRIEYDGDNPVRRRLFDPDDCEEELEHIDPGTICSLCNRSDRFIQERGLLQYENPPDFIERRECGQWYCKSCSYDGIKCSDCGLSEKLVKIKCDRNVRFKSDEAWPELHYCEGCLNRGWVRLDEVSCIYCGEDHYPWEIDAPEECYELWSTYSDEYVIDTNGDPTLIETENTVVGQGLKAEFKDIMDDFFKFSESIPEWEYISIVNKMKSVYEKI